MVEYKATLMSSDIAQNTEDNIITDIQFSDSGNNISANMSNIINVSNVVRNPFIIGKSKLGNGATFSGGERYFVAKQYSTDTILNFDVYTEKSSTGIIIAFDTRNNKYPDSFTVNGTTITPQSSIVVCIVGTQTVTENGETKYKYSFSVSSQFSDGTPMVISGIYFRIKFELNKNRLYDIDITQNSRTTYNKPKFGLNSNSGTIKINDYDERLLEYIRLNQIRKGSSIDVFIVSGQKSSPEKVARMYVTSIDYDNNNYNVTLGIGDNLVIFQQIIINEIMMSDTQKTALDLYNILKNYAVGFNFSPTESAISVLTNTVIKYPVLSAGKLWNAFYKLCNLCGLYMYIGANNDVVIDTQLLS